MNDIHSSQNDHSPRMTFGMRLQSAREAQGLSIRDAAARLRLNEKIILMMEKEQFPSDFPITFVRGYIRSYGKMLQMSEAEIIKALEPIKPKAPVLDPAISQIKPAKPITSGNYFMQLSTYVILLTLIGLVGTWWFSHGTTSTTPPTFAESLKNASPVAPAIPTPTHLTQTLQTPVLPVTQTSVSPPPNQIAENTASVTKPAAPIKARAKPVVEEEEYDDEEAEGEDYTD